MTLGALRRISYEDGATLVASATDPLLNWLADKVLATGARRQCKRRILMLLATCFENIARLWKRRFSKTDHTLGFAGLRRRVARAFLAANMLTVDANLFGTEASFAAMASAVNSQSNGFDHTLNS